MKKILLFGVFLFLGLHTTHALEQSSSGNVLPISCTVFENPKSLPITLVKSFSGTTVDTVPLSFGDCVPWDTPTKIYAVNNEGEQFFLVSIVSTSFGTSYYEDTAGLENVNILTKDQSVREVRAVVEKEDDPSIYEAITLRHEKLFLINGKIEGNTEYLFQGFFRTAPKFTGIVPFTDIKSHFAEDFIKKLYGYGIVKGRSATVFAPEGMLTRAEALKIMWTSFGQISEKEMLQDYKTWLTDGISNDMDRDHEHIFFRDVHPSAWYAPYVWMMFEKSADGLSRQSDTFRPDSPITRAEFAKLAVFGAHLRIVQSNPILYQEADSINNWIQATVNLHKQYAYFADVPEDSWMFPYTGYLREFKYVDPNEYFYPERAITRGEAAKIIAKLLEARTLGSYD